MVPASIKEPLASVSAPPKSKFVDFIIPVDMLLPFIKVAPATPNERALVPSPKLFAVVNETNPLNPIA